jgi:MoaA/NifB/PqqE/SkfB family radical SAM enzyme
MEWLYPILKRKNWQVTVTTNGSLIKENEELFKKYSDVFYVTVSYDFMHQKDNREEFDVIEMANVLNNTCKQWQWQCVLPIDRPDSFSFENIKNIVSTCYKTGCRSINIIPLRHKRGKDKFEVIIDNLDLKQFLDAFLQFLQILYIKKISVYIDGSYMKVDKAYFGEHNKLILSPDGFIYPEFDFLEYKTEYARIGNWKTKQIWKNQGDRNRIHGNCFACEKRPSCGLKYLYYMFEEYPKGNCKEFYTYIDWAIMHVTKLRSRDNLIEWVGVQEDFEIIEAP